MFGKPVLNMLYQMVYIKYNRLGLIALWYGKFMKFVSTLFESGLELLAIFITNKIVCQVLVRLLEHLAVYDFEIDAKLYENMCYR